MLGTLRIVGNERCGVRALRNVRNPVRLASSPSIPPLHSFLNLSMGTVAEGGRWQCKNLDTMIRLSRAKPPANTAPLQYTRARPDATRRKKKKKKKKKKTGLG